MKYKKELKRRSNAFELRPGLLKGADQSCIPRKWSEGKAGRGRERERESGRVGGGFVILSSYIRYCGPEGEHK